MRQFLVADIGKLDYFLRERHGRRSGYGEGKTMPVRALNPSTDLRMRILDEQEKAIVRQLIRDPRESDNGVGEVTGVNVRTVSRKRDRLEQEGILSYYTNLDLSGDGAKQYNARHLYIIKFRVGITYNQLIQDIRQDSNQQSVFTETIFESHIAEIDGGPQRRPAPEIGGFDVGSVVEQKPCDIQMVVQDSHQQRADSVRIREVDVGVRLDQQPGRFRTTVARCI